MRTAFLEGNEDVLGNSCDILARIDRPALAQSADAQRPPTRTREFP